MGEHYGGESRGLLTCREQELVSACQRGEPLVCSHLTPCKLADSKDPEHCISAAVLRDLLLGQYGDLTPHGVLLVGARVTGQLDLNNATSRVNLQMINCSFETSVRANGAHLLSVTLSGSHVPAFLADGLQVDNDVQLDQGFTASGAGPDGAVRLLDAHIAGGLSCRGGMLRNDNGPALNADGLEINGDVFLDRGFTATGAGPDGAVRLLDARITGLLSCRGATLRNDSGPALSADRVQVNSDMFVDEGFNATGARPDGAVRLPGAHVGGMLSCRGATLRNDSGPAMHADGLKVDGDVLMDQQFTAGGRDARGAVHLDEARVGGTLSLLGARVSNPAGPLLDLDSASVGRVVLSPETVCPADNAVSAEHAKHRSCRIRLDGLHYTGVEGASWAQWLHWLRYHHDPDYAAQPYQQLADLQRNAGEDEAVRRILIMQQQHLGTRLRGWSAVAHRVFGRFIGYGYRSGRALLGLAVVLALGIGFGLLAGSVLHVAAHTRDTAFPGSSCSLVEQIGLGVDHALPLISTGVRARCDLSSTTPAGQVLTALAWMLQLAAWALATLFIAGYTGLIRKPS